MLVTQTLGALNDNMFKNAMVVLVLFRAASQGPALVAAAGGVFILPYVLLSATAGLMADKWDKSRSIRIVKWAELALMVVAAAALLLGSTALMFAVLFGLGVQATFFSPLKYAILPDHLSEHELVAGNGLVEAGTFLGILAGTIAGGALVSLPDGTSLVAAAGLLVATAGVASAYRVRPAPSSAPALRIGWNAAGETAALLRSARANRPVWRCLLGLSWFWAIGATLVTELPALVRDVLQGDAHVVTLLLTFFSIGVGLGSVLCARLLRGEVSAWPVPFAGLGLTLLIADFSFAVTAASGLHTAASLLRHPAGWHLLADLLLLSACGGVYSVPLYAVLQDRSAPSERARMVAANNVINAVAIAAGAVLAAILAIAGVSPVFVLLLFAAANTVVAVTITPFGPSLLARLLRFASK